MEKTTLYLPHDLQYALKEYARRAGRPQAEVVREALTLYLGQQPRPRPRSIGVAEKDTVPAADAEAWLEANWRFD